MNARRASRLAALSVVAGALPFAACGEKKPGGPGPAVALSIQLRAPGDALVKTYCPNTGAILLTIDDVDRERTYLFDPDGNLHGCMDGPCDEQAIQTAFTAPRKITVEAIDLAVAAYTPGARFDVVCRGVADGRIPGDIEIEGTLVTANVKVLRVGGINPLFDPVAEHPRSYYLAGAPTRAVPPFGTISRTSTGGGIVFAGGFDPVTRRATSDLHVFDVRSLTMRVAAQGLETPRGGLTATAIEADGETSILFAGGATSTTSQSLATAELYQNGTLGTLSLHKGRSGHSAVYLAGGALQNSVILVGGCNRGLCPEPLSAPNDATATIEAFYLRRPDGGPPPACLGAPGAPGSCTYNVNDVGCGANCAGTPRSLGAAGPLKDPNAVLYSGQGYVGAGSATGEGWALDGSTFSTYTILGGNLDVFAPAVATLGTGGLGIFGGYLPGGTSSAETARVTSLGDTLAPMRSPRGDHTATALLDGNVVVTGGNVDNLTTPAYTRTVEIYTVAADQFIYLTRVGETCTAPGQPGCETMSTTRAGHAAVRIDGARSWLNGAVVIAGGRRNEADEAAPDLFVPAYLCDDDGMLPERLDGLVDFCDRGRIASDPADPREP